MIYKFHAFYNSLKLFVYDILIGYYNNTMISMYDHVHLEVYLTYVMGSVIGERVGITHMYPITDSNVYSYQLNYIKIQN